MQISVYTAMESTKEAIFQQKTQNQSIRGQIAFGIQLQTFASKCNTRKLQPKTWNRDEKNSFERTMQLFSPSQRNWKEGVFNFLHLCFNNFWAPGTRDVYISKKSSFVLVFAGQKHISLLGSATFDRLFIGVR